MAINGNVLGVAPSDFVDAKTGALISGWRACVSIPYGAKAVEAGAQGLRAVDVFVPATRCPAGVAVGDAVAVDLVSFAGKYKFRFNSVI